MTPQSLPLTFIRGQIDSDEFLRDDEAKDNTTIVRVKMIYLTRHLQLSIDTLQMAFGIGMWCLAERGLHLLIIGII